MRSTEAGPGAAGKIVRGVLGATVAVAVTAGATYAMGLWQFGDTPEAAAGAARPLRAPVAVSGKTVTVLGAGSILPSPEVWDQARRDGGGTIDFGRVLAGARTAVASADLALCHLSAPVAPAAGPFAGAPRYNVPPQIAQAIAKTGFDGCATAAERAFDQNSPGLARTLDALDKAKVGHAGTYRDEESAERTKLYTVDGVKVAHLSYTSGLAGGIKLPAGREWAVAFATEDRVKEDARRAREAGAAIVVVSIDWGSEGEQEPDADQQTLARAIATMRDVDLVFGHGAHTVQPIERLDGKWIVYGLGDLASRSAQPVNENREGAMIRVTFSPGDDEGRWKVAAVEAIPTFVDLNPDIRSVDLEQALADPSLSAGRRQIYAAAADRIKGQLLTRGAGDAKVVIRGTQS